MFSGKNIKMGQNSSYETLYESMILCDIRVSRIEQEVASVEADMQQTQISTSSDRELGPANNPKNDTDPSTSATTEKIKRSKASIIKLEGYTNELNEMMQGCINFSQYIVVQIVMKHIQVCTLSIKRVILKIKRDIALSTKEILVKAAGGTGSGNCAEISIPVSTTLTEYKAISILISGVVKSLEMVLKFLPSIMSVEPHKMCFFMTPKSFKKTDMKVINSNGSICDKLPESVKTAIVTLENVHKVANISIKVASIAAGGAAMVASAKKKGPIEIPDNMCKAMECVNVYNMITSISNTLALLPFADPMPKYEKLSITNIGFLTWLITGFVPAGHKSFGIMGMP